MPLYEYVCERCASEFEDLVFGSETPACPRCAAKQVRRVLSVVAVGKSGHEPVAAAPVGACGTCGDPRGPGACAMDRS